MRLIATVGWICGLAAYAVEPAWAETAVAETQGLRAVPAVTASDWLQMLGGLALVMLLIIGCAWMARRVSGAGGFGNSHLKVLSAMSLGARERIALIEVGGEQVLIGVTPNSIRRIHVLENPVDTSAPARQTDFAKRMQDVLRRGQADAS